MLVITLLGTVTVGAVTGQGTLQLSFGGYGVVQGQLQNAIIYPNNTIFMTMNVNDRIQASQGAIPITATGLWNGVSNGAEVSGSIQNVVGKVHGCVFLWCGDANFVGQGQFTGSLNASHANGTFNGTITFTNPPVQDQQMSMSGSWSADFLTPVPEFRFDSVALILAFIAAIVLVSIHRRPTRQD